MGRIKSTLVKRTAENLVESMSESFTDDYENNKKVLGSTMPSKRIRNKIAGYITRINRRSSSKAEEKIKEVKNG
jgi:small subunit ribosomal protein S17e